MRGGEGEREGPAGVPPEGYWGKVCHIEKVLYFFWKLTWENKVGPCPKFVIPSDYYGL